jgi:uncharacterized repeat protein (TIGR04076 family)
MFELKVAVSKVMGTCTSDVPMTRGDHFLVRDGDITIPEGGHICLYALQNLLPVITPKERALAEAHDEDWMWRIRHVQCPDPNGRVIFTVDQVRKLEKGDRTAPQGTGSQPRHQGGSETAAAAAAPDKPARTRDLRVVVERVGGTCTSQMKLGDSFLLRGGRLYLPAGRPFCLYALAATLPLLPAKQRRLEEGDWMATDHRVICPDPAGNVVLRIDPL